jgi:histone acetyltransferase (RNA polymerase elongator complex component)
MGAAPLVRKDHMRLVEAWIEGLAREAKERARPGELAFYGGTFTAMPRDRLERILDGVMPWVNEGIFSGIRFSTRPDALTSETCRFLARYPIQTVELGVQSLSDEVLTQSQRGYSAESVVGAVRRIRKQGWSLGLQLMVGLPGDSRRRFLESVEGVMDLGPDFVRIYPTLVLKDTLLARWLETGRFRTLTLEEAVDWCAAAYDGFLSRNIPVVRMGLHPDRELMRPGVILGGPFHPAFGYLVRVRWWRDRIDQWCLQQARSFQDMELVLRVPREVLSEVVGPSRDNISYWRKKWGWTGFRLAPMEDWPVRRFEIFIVDE